MYFECVTLSHPCPLAKRQLSDIVVRETYPMHGVLWLSAYCLYVMAVAIASSTSIIASEALVLVSTWWNTYGTIRMARASNQDVSMMYLLLRDGGPLLSHPIQAIF